MNRPKSQRLKVPEEAYKSKPFLELGFVRYSCLCFLTYTNNKKKLWTNFVPSLHISFETVILGRHAKLWEVTLLFSSSRNDSPYEPNNVCMRALFEFSLKLV